MTQTRSLFPKSNLPESFEVAVLAANAAEDKKAVDVCVMEVGHVSSLSDYFVICTGESPAQLKAIGDHIHKTLVAEGLELVGQERDHTGRWVLLDYGDVVVHMMNPGAREFYSIETFWNHASRIDRKHWATPPQRQAS